jgi:hypothetical protein
VPVVVSEKASPATKQIANELAGYLHSGQIQETFFSVPKGTKQVQYFWAGGAHKVLGPDRKVVAEVVMTPVPAGADGKVWSFSPHAHGQLWFFNVPNVLAASPDALLMPKESVARDGLPTPKE